MSDRHSGEDKDWMGHGYWNDNDEEEMGYGGRDYDQEEQDVEGLDQGEDARGLGGFDDDEEAVLVVQRKQKWVTNGTKFSLLIYFFSLQLFTDHLCVR